MKQLDEISLEPGERTAIEEAARIIRGLVPTERIVVFGSKARGDDDAESDIDILVITSRRISRAERHAIVDALFPIQIARQVVLSPLIVSDEDWRTGRISVLPIRMEIEEQGAAA